MDDVIVIGGGIVGASTAYHLARAGAHVTVIDRAHPGQATAAGAGIIAPGSGFREPAAYFSLRSEERRVGKECRYAWWPYD